MTALFYIVAAIFALEVLMIVVLIYLQAFGCGRKRKL
jgi:hypothetical protein